MSLLVMWRNNASPCALSDKGLGCGSVISLAAQVDSSYDGWSADVAFAGVNSSSSREETRQRLRQGCTAGRQARNNVANPKQS
jgi:hypothetical protein